MPDNLSSRELEGARSVSEALFGAKHRLPMAIVVGRANDDDLYAAALAARAGTTEVQAGSELRMLERVGLLERRPPDARAKGQRGRPPKRYMRRKSAFWELAAELLTELVPPR